MILFFDSWYCILIYYSCETTHYSSKFSNYSPLFILTTVQPNARHDNNTHNKEGTYLSMLNCLMGVQLRLHHVNCILSFNLGQHQWPYLNCTSELPAANMTASSKVNHIQLTWSFTTPTSFSCLAPFPVFFFCSLTVELCDCWNY